MPRTIIAHIKGMRNWIQKAVPTNAMSISSESPVTPRSKYTEKATIVNHCSEIVQIILKKKQDFTNIAMLN